jgi:hypothetical protein
MKLESGLFGSLAPVDAFVARDALHSRARQLPEECAPTEPPVEPNPPRDAMPDEGAVRDAEPADLEPEKNDPPPCPEDERPDRQGSPGLGLAGIAAPGAARALQSVRGVRA